MPDDKAYKHFTVKMPEDLHRRFKAATASEGRTMLDVLMELIEKYLDGKQE